MQEITIEGQDILDWMQKRNKVKADWPQKLKVIKIKGQEVVESLKSSKIEEIKDVLEKEKRDKDTPFNYNDFVELNEKLVKSKEAEARTIFGGYSSKNIKNIQALLKLFEKDHLNAISLAHEISQIISFDFVAAKKNAKLYENQINDLTTKISLFETSIKNSRHEIWKLVKHYTSNFFLDEQHAEKLNFNDLIHQYVNQFGKKATKIVEMLKNIDFARICDYYARFYEINNLKKSEKGKFDSLLWIFQKGDTLSSDFYNRTITNNFSSIEMYSNILEQKGFVCEGAEVNKIKGNLIRNRGRMGDRRLQSRSNRESINSNR